MTEFAAAEARIIARVQEVETLARALYPRYAAFATPSVKFIYKGTRGGDCNYEDNEYRFNVGHAVQSDHTERLTVPHEVAHMVAYRVFGLVGHKAQWKRVCLALGGDGKRCFSAMERGVVIEKARRESEYMYKDSMGYEIWIGSARHKRLQKDGYTRKTKRGTVRYSGYSLRTGRGSTITKEGFQGRSRMV